MLIASAARVGTTPVYALFNHRAALPKVALSLRPCARGARLDQLGCTVVHASVVRSALRHGRRGWKRMVRFHGARGPAVLRSDRRRSVPPARVVALEPADRPGVLPAGRRGAMGTRHRADGGAHGGRRRRTRSAGDRVGGGVVTVRFRPVVYVAPTRVWQVLGAVQRSILAVLAAGGSLAPGRVNAVLEAESVVGDDRIGLRQVREALVELRTFGLVGHAGHGRGSRWFLVPQDGP